MSFVCASFGGAAGEHVAEGLDLLGEHLHVGQIERARRRGGSRGSGSLPRPRAGPWSKRKASLAASSRRGISGQLGRGEEEVRHELHDERDVHVHRALELGQAADVDRRLLEVHVLLEALGGDDVPEQVDHVARPRWSPSSSPSGCRAGSAGPRTRRSACSRQARSAKSFIATSRA